MWELNRQSMSDAGYSMLGAGARGWPREMLWGGMWEGGSCLGTHVRIKDFKIKKKKESMLKINTCVLKGEQDWVESHDRQCNHNKLQLNPQSSGPGIMDRSPLCWGKGATPLRSLSKNHFQAGSVPCLEREQKLLNSIEGNFQRGHKLRIIRSPTVPSAGRIQASGL